jgi:tetratricopeptide (TPR) repeat protein
MAAVPTSHLVREEMVSARAPKWGGSRLEQASLAFDAWVHRGENPRMWFVVGGALVSIGDDWSRRNRRLSELLYSLALRCDDATSWYERRARARRYLGDEDGAIADAREILKQSPRSQFAWLLISEVYQNRGDWAAAAREMDAALELSPDSVPFLERRAYSHSKARNMAAAEADYQRLLELDRSSVHFQAYSRFLVDEKRRDFDHAVALMSEATQLDPTDPENWGHLGAAQYMTGDPGRIESYERFLELLDTNDPENAERARSIRAYLDGGAPARGGSRRRSPQEVAEAVARREAAAAKRASAATGASGGR